MPQEKVFSRRFGSPGTCARTRERKDPTVKMAATVETPRNCKNSPRPRLDVSDVWGDDWSTILDALKDGGPFGLPRTRLLTPTRGALAMSSGAMLLKRLRTGVK